LGLVGVPRARDLMTVGWIMMTVGWSKLRLGLGLEEGRTPREVFAELPPAIAPRAPGEHSKGALFRISPYPPGKREHGAGKVVCCFPFFPPNKKKEKKKKRNNPSFLRKKLLFFCPFVPLPAHTQCLSCPGVFP